MGCESRFATLIFSPFTFLSPRLCPSTAGCSPPPMSSTVLCLLLSSSRWFLPSVLCRLAIFCLVGLLISSLSLVATLRTQLLSLTNKQTDKKPKVATCITQCGLSNSANERVWSALIEESVFYYQASSACNATEVARYIFISVACTGYVTRRGGSPRHNVGRSPQIGPCVDLLQQGSVALPPAILSVRAVNVQAHSYKKFAQLPAGLRACCQRFSYYNTTTIELRSSATPSPPPPPLTPPPPPTHRHTLLTGSRFDVSKCKPVVNKRDSYVNT